MLQAPFFAYPYLMKHQTRSLKNRTLILEWNSDFSVGVNEMDEQHILLFALFNDVYAALEDEPPSQVSEPLVSAFVDRTREHFAAEERLLCAAGFPGLPDHSDHHRDLDI